MLKSPAGSIQCLTPNARFYWPNQFQSLNLLRHAFHEESFHADTVRELAGFLAAVDIAVDL